MSHIYRTCNTCGKTFHSTGGYYVTLCPKCRKLRKKKVTGKGKE